VTKLHRLKSTIHRFKCIDLGLRADGVSMGE